MYFNNENKVTNCHCHIMNAFIKNIYERDVLTEVNYMKVICNVKNLLTPKIIDKLNVLENCSNGNCKAIFL